MRRVAVADLGQVPEAGELEPRVERRDESITRLGAPRRGVAAHAAPRVDKRTGEPRPHRTLVIAAIGASTGPPT